MTAAWITWPLPSLAEARTLREAGFTENPILMLRGSADPQEVEELLKLGVTLSWAVGRTTSP